MAKSKSKKKQKHTYTDASEIQNASKTLFANIRFASVDFPIKSIAITSSIPNEGKSTTSVNLARAIGSAGQSVLLVEADLRKRSLSRRLNVHPAHGAYSVLSRSVSLESAVAPTDMPNVSFLDVEPNIPNPADLFASRAYEALVEQLTARYDYVIFDTAPVGVFVDAAVLSRLVDGVVMIVKTGGPKRSEVLAAYDQLKKADAHIIGACATFCPRVNVEYYAYYNSNNERIGSSEDLPEPNNVTMQQPASAMNPRASKGAHRAASSVPTSTPRRTR